MQAFLLHLSLLSASIFLRSTAEFFPKTAGEVGQRAKTGLKSDLCDRQVACSKQVFCIGKPQVSQILSEGNSHLAAKTKVKIIWGVSGESCGICNADGFMEVGVDIPQRPVDRCAGHSSLRRRQLTQHKNQ